MLEAVAEISAMDIMLTPKTLLKKAMPAAALLVLAGCGGGSDSDSDLQSVTVALSGFIDIETGTRVDADNADALTLNSTPRSTAQSLPQEYVLAGYVSAFDGVYPSISGFPSFAYSADPSDEFSMSLRTGQSVELQAFGTREGASALRLSLVQGSSVVETKVTDSMTGQIRVTNTTGSDGSFTVRVESEGPTPMLYVLSTAVNASGQAKSFDWPAHEFVEGEAIVALEASPDPVSAQAMMAQASMLATQELAPGLWRVKAPVQVMATSGQSAQVATLDWIRTLKQQPGVESATPNYRMTTMMTPVDEPLYGAQQWHYGLLNGPTAWQLAPQAGANVTVAVMDTGLYRASSGDWHQDINANVISPLPSEASSGSGTDFVSEQFDNDGQPGPDDNPADPGNSVGGSVYHGTHVAGTVAAVVNNNGGGGVAFNSTLLPVRVLGDGGSGSSADLLAALQWVAGPPSGQPLADIVNLSLGGLPFIQSMQDAISTATNRGVIFVAAAGNSSTRTESYPAAFEDVFAVSAVDGAGALASYSNFGTWVDLAAPGGDASRDGNGDGRGDVVVSTSVINGTEETYIGLQGTSMAAPHVSGVLALMKGENAALDYEDINGFLMAGDLTVADCGSQNCPKTEQFGWGLLDASKAASAAQATPIRDLLTATPAVVSLSSEGARTANVELEVYGDNPSTVTINSVSPPPAWLSIDSAPASTDSGTSFDISVSLNLEALEPGVSERTTIEVEYQGDSQVRTLEIPVVGQQVTDQQARDAGRHFVLLVSPEPDGNFFTTEAQTNVVAENGQYRFVFEPDDGVPPKELNEVSPGNYILVAGSDLDNDGLICHGGEACAEYPVAGLRQEITISAGTAIEGIRMTTSYSRPSISASSPEQLPRPDFQGYQLLSPTNPDATNLKALSQP
ncbi:S8 family serine peptidase [Marinobacter alexandrii]|uniref:S8 family serine peptidase n=1 Tax=Marinobacter alexandrii TaxID=2570351 RepID=UPI001FFFA526|nr:S8 family serine peptidase [Marinobacter alexandrii]MCK2151044.1 S8 family serine peptidase [Marinobacter alexandrii]